MSELRHPLLAAALGRGLEAETIDWLSRVEQKPSAQFLRALDRFIRGGKRNGWWDRIGDMLVLGAETQQAALEGLKGTFTEDDMTVGVVSHVPYIGMTPAEGNAYVQTGVNVADLPLVSLNSHSLGVVCTTNFAGSWQEAGRTGTAGAQSFMIRASSGFRSGFWPGAAQVIFGAGSCNGLTMGVRQNSGGGLVVRNGEAVPFVSASISMPVGEFTFMKPEPAAAGSPNTLFMVFVGDGNWTEELCTVFYEDITEFVAAVGSFDLIQPEPSAFGLSCFGYNAVQDILPLDMRVFQQSTPPPTDLTDYDAFAFFPGSDFISRPYTFTQSSAESMVADPVATTNGSPIVTITSEAHGLAVDDIAAPASLTAVNGITAEMLNREMVVLSVPTADTFTCQPGGNANATGSGGGADGTIAFRKIRLQTSTYTFPERGGKFWSFVWSDRGERAETGGPIVSHIVKPNDLNPPIIRRTGAFAGVSCRTAFTTHERAIGATLVYMAHIVGYADRDDVDDPLGQGYLDIAEAYDLVEADVLTWQEMVDTKETLFDTGLQGFAVCYDKARLSPKQASELSQWADQGILIDLEHSDSRTPEVMLDFMTRAGQICAAKGFGMAWLGHFMNGEQATRNGFTPGPDGNAPTIINDPNLTYANIIVRQVSVPPDITDSLNAQRNYFIDSLGEVPDEKLLVSCALGVGQQAVSLEKCAAVQQWVEDHPGVAVHVSRAAQQQGGNELRFPNQQQVTYFPSLSTRAITAAQFADAFDRKVSIGATRKTQITTLIQNMMDDGTWWLIDALWLYAAENSGQALRDLKGLVLSEIGGSSPTFTADQGYTFDGTDDYLASGFIPATSGAHMEGDDQAIGVWERSNTSSDGYAAGALQSTTRNLSVISTAVNGLNKGRANGELLEFSNVTGSAFRMVSRQGTTVRGQTITASVTATNTSYTVAANAENPPNREVYVGCRNNAGTAADFRACQLSALVMAGSLTADQVTSIGQRIRAHLQAIGAI